MLKVAWAALAVAYFEVSHMSAGAWVTFSWLHIPLTSRQMAVIHHTIG